VATEVVGVVLAVEALPAVDFRMEAFDVGSVAFPDSGAREVHARCGQTGAGADDRAGAVRVDGTRLRHAAETPHEQLAVAVEGAYRERDAFGGPGARVETVPGRGGSGGDGGNRGTCANGNGAPGNGGNAGFRGQPHPTVGEGGSYQNYPPSGGQNGSDGQ